MRLIRALGVVLPVVVLTACGTAHGIASVTETPHVAANGDTFVLVFADEFDSGTAPASTNWTIETGYGPKNNGWGNNEWQLYTDSPDNVRVENGNLVLTAQCPVGPCGVRDGTVTSGKINSLGKFNFTFGKIIARIKPPVGDAAWPAFWSLGANYPVVGWPWSGELDVLEMHNFHSDERTTHTTMHWCEETLQAPEPCSFPDGWVFDTQHKTFPASLGDDFHIWEVDWNAERPPSRHYMSQCLATDLGPTCLLETRKCQPPMGWRYIQVDHPPYSSRKQAPYGPFRRAVHLLPPRAAQPGGQ